MSMYEIGATLRETRMRARIDISEVEEKTKIRAKYLRALENEEWLLLPGPTYIKSFLRTYAEYLDLDAGALVDEYRLRYEKPQATDRKPVGGSLGKGREQTRRPVRVPRGLIILVICAALVAVLFVLGSQSDDKNGDSRVTGSTETSTVKKKKATVGKSSPPKKVSLQIVPSAEVWACLENAKGQKLIPGKAISPGTTPRTYRSSSFKLTLGNGSAELKINGRMKTVPESSEGVGYAITSKGRRSLSKAQRPTCK